MQDNNDFINIPRELYVTLVDSFQKVLDLYKENGELRGKIISLENTNKLLQTNYIKSSNQLDETKVSSETFGDIEVSGLKREEENKNYESEELIFSTKKDSLQEIQEIKNSSRVVGFWIFMFSLVGILGNFWIQNFVLLARDVIITIGVFVPFLIGGLLAVLNPKLPGTLGWIITFLTSTFFVLNYFNFLTII
jgi:hypothetical protein